MTSRPAAAPNAVVRPVVDYLPDHRGAQLFAALTGRDGRNLNGPRAVIEGSPTWHGWTRPLQRTKGAQAVIARQQGGVPPIAPKSSELMRETTTSDPAVAAIFLSRMSRR